MTDQPYHHGDLRRVLLQHAERAVLESGPAGLSLRDLARRAGVSHAAPAHHFGDKAGLLTAMTADGFRMLADRLTEVFERTGSFLEVGVAYVQFAADHRAHFEVMYRTDLYDASAAEVIDARAAAAEALSRGIATLPADTAGADPKVARLAAWSLVHGFASLWLGGALPLREGADLTGTAREVARFLVERGRERVARSD